MLDGTSFTPPFSWMAVCATSLSLLSLASVTAAFCWTRSQAAPSDGLEEEGFSPSSSSSRSTPDRQTFKKVSRQEKHLRGRRDDTLFLQDFRSALFQDRQIRQDCHHLKKQFQIFYPERGGGAPLSCQCGDYFTWSLE